MSASLRPVPSLCRFSFCTVICLRKPTFAPFSLWAFPPTRPWSLTQRVILTGPPLDQTLRTLAVPPLPSLSVYPSDSIIVMPSLTFRWNTVQLLYGRSSIHLRYLKVSNPSMHSALLSPVILKDASTHQLPIETYLLYHRILMFLSHSCVLWCLIIRPSGMRMPHRLQWGSGALPSCTTAPREKKCLYTKCYLIRPVLCATSG